MSKIDKETSSKKTLCKLITAVPAVQGVRQKTTTYRCWCDPVTCRTSLLRRMCLFEGVSGKSMYMYIYVLIRLRSGLNTLLTMVTSPLHSKKG